MIPSPGFVWHSDEEAHAKQTRPPRVALGNSNPAQDSGCHEHTEELEEG